MGLLSICSSGFYIAFSGCRISLRGREGICFELIHHLIQRHAILHCAIDELSVVYPNISTPMLFPGTLRDIGIRRVITPWHMRHSNGATKDSNVVWFPHHAAQEYHCIVLNGPWPPIGWIAHCPVASGTLDLFKRRESWIDSIVCRAQEFHERLRVRFDRRNRWRRPDKIVRFSRQNRGAHSHQLGRPPRR